MRVNILLSCGECKRRNYATEKNKKNTTSKLELKKFCPFCGKQTPHKESK
jgi:large subunit ribosomal protein L33